MDLLTRLERRFGRFAIPGLVQAVAVLQLLTLGLLYMSRPEAREALARFLDLDAAGILRGEVWRVVSHLFLPRSMSPLWALIGAMLLMWFGRGLDEGWGAFRVNLYVLGGVLALAAGALIFGYSGGGLWFYQSLLLAFAVTYPNEEIMVAFIIPVKVKWLAVFAAAGTLLVILAQPSAFWQALFAHLNFIVAFGPGGVRYAVGRARTAERRARFQETADAAFFHQCSVCRRTEVEAPQLDFRVTEDGDEICNECRSAKEAAS
jgi:hypothetical protein